jgi:hypothetical protein
LRCVLKVGFLLPRIHTAKRLLLADYAKVQKASMLRSDGMAEAQDEPLSLIQPVKEGRECDLQGVGHLPNCVDLDVDPAALQEAHVSPVQTAGDGEGFLRETLL